MTKRRAFLIHFSASISVLTLFISIMLIIWSPEPYFTINGGWTVLKILFGVDVILGPLLTFVVFKPNKPSLKFDLSVIIAIQLSALVYGITITYQQRPAFVVFGIDRFTIVRAADIEFSKLPVDLIPTPFISKPRLVRTELPENAKQREELLFGVITGNKLDIEFHAEFYRPYPPPIEQLTAHSIDIEKITAHDNHAHQIVAAFLDQRDLKIDAVLYFPLRGKYGDHIFVLDKNTGQPIGAIAISPWASDYPTG
jgi:hypothetical protein